MNFSVLTLTFIAINIDFFIMLIFLLKQYSLIKVMIGYALAVFALLLVGFLVGDILEKFLPEWILGILGLLPIYMAFKDDDDDDTAGKNGKKSAIYAVFVTYLSVCTGCVLSIFVPILIGKSWFDFGEASLYLIGLTILIVLLAKAVESNHFVQGLIEKHGEILMKICYVLIGIYVLFDSGLIEHLIKLF
ncbi:cadmium resistance transporter [Fructilactobacillus frigidiflavus]|uniref:cadmium resistance transporter n=1 Tax=Fructilactobacillus frigidiflavus TaxID=3242688 RepID=UPI0037573D96